MKEGTYGDQSALRALAQARHGALCTIVGIDGSYSRRLGAQLAILADGSISGSLADGCLEAQLAHEASDAAEQGGTARLLRFGNGSPIIDFRLPCGSGIDVLVEPQPDHTAIRNAVKRLDRRLPATLSLTAPEMTAPFVRHYCPGLRLLVLGSGPEPAELTDQANAFGIEVEWLKPRDKNGGSLSLYQATNAMVDPWTAIVVLFHDHEWERGLLPWALQSKAFYVGAQGGALARAQRNEMLTEAGIDPTALHSPVGLIPSARTPSVLALSILAEIVGEFEALQNNVQRQGKFEDSAPLIHVYGG